MMCSFSALLFLLSLKMKYSTSSYKNVLLSSIYCQIALWVAWVGYRGGLESNTILKFKIFYSKMAVS